MRRWRIWSARGRDLRARLAGTEFDGNTQADQAVHLERYWAEGDIDELPLSFAPGALAGLDIAAWALIPPVAPIHGLEFRLLDARGETLAEGACAIEPDIGEAGRLRLRFDPIQADGSLRLRLTGTRSAQAAALKLFERRRVQALTRRVRSRAWLTIPHYA